MDKELLVRALRDLKGIEAHLDETLLAISNDKRPLGESHTLLSRAWTQVQLAQMNIENAMKVLP
jgi:hypothetical protein